MPYYYYLINEKNETTYKKRDGAGNELLSGSQSGGD